MIGELVGHYRLEQELGSGTYGVVYRGVHEEDPELQVAIKVVHTMLLDDPKFVDSLKAECRRLDRMDHPGIVRFRDLVIREGCVAMVLELLQGQDLHDHLQGKKVELGKAIEILDTLLGALAYAHSLGVVHRDIKPSNIYVCDDGRLKILDFGIARAAQSTQATQTGTLKGTLDYMAPERFSAEGGGPHSDVYAMGLVAWELLAGRVACPDGDLPAKLGWHLGVGPSDVREVRSDCPGWLAEVITKLVDRGATARPQDGDLALKLFRDARAAAGPSTAAAPAAPARPAAPGTVALDKDAVADALRQVTEESAPAPEPAPSLPPTPTPEVAAAPEPTPALPPMPTPEVAAAPEPTPAPAPEPTPALPPTPTPEVAAAPEPTPAPAPTSASASTPAPEPAPAATPAAAAADMTADLMGRGKAALSSGLSTLAKKLNEPTAVGAPVQNQRGKVGDALRIVRRGVYSAVLVVVGVLLLLWRTFQRVTARRTVRDIAEGEVFEVLAQQESTKFYSGFTSSWLWWRLKRAVVLIFLCLVVFGGQVGFLMNEVGSDQTVWFGMASLLLIVPLFSIPFFRFGKLLKTLGGQDRVPRAMWKTGLPLVLIWAGILGPLWHTGWLAEGGGFSKPSGWYPSNSECSSAQKTCKKWGFSSYNKSRKASGKDASLCSKYRSDFECRRKKREAYRSAWSSAEFLSMAAVGGILFLFIIGRLMLLRQYREDYQRLTEVRPELAQLPVFSTGKAWWSAGYLRKLGAEMIEASQTDAQAS